MVAAEQAWAAWHAVLGFVSQDLLLESGGFQQRRLWWEAIRLQPQPRLRKTILISQLTSIYCTMPRPHFDYGDHGVESYSSA